MPKNPDPKKLKIIKDAFETHKKINLYQLGKLCGCDASTVSPIIERMLQNGKLYESYVSENGITKRYFSTDPFPNDEKNAINAIQKPQFISNDEDIPKFVQKLTGYYQKIEDAFSTIKSNDEKEYRNAWKIIINTISDIYGISSDEDEVNKKLTLDFEIFKNSTEELIKFFKKIAGENDE